MRYRFGEYELDSDCRELRRHGNVIFLQPKVFDLLYCLLQNRSRIVTKDELLDTIWGDVIVSSNSLQRAVSLARAALREGGMDSAIRTFPGHGYRFCMNDGQDVSTTSSQPDMVKLTAAREAFAKMDFAEAADTFAATDAESGLSADDLERWAEALHNLGRCDDVELILERSLAGHLTSGERCRAARCALKLAQICFERREMAVARGWHRRALSLLGEIDTCREHGLAAWMESRLLATGGNLAEAEQKAREALRIGRQVEDPDLEALGLVYAGLWSLSQGKIKSGRDLQDEAGAYVLAGQLQPMTSGTVYCALIWGCINIGDWQPANEWTEQFTKWCSINGVSSFPGLCNLHRAEVLSVQGKLEDALAEATRACEQLSASAPWAEGDAYRVAGEIHLLRGDLDAAERSFDRASQLGWDSQPGLAMLMHQRGKTDLAIKSLERTLGGANWNHQSRRGLLLAHLAALLAQNGDLDQAGQMLNECRQLVEQLPTPGLQALEAWAGAELAIARNDFTNAEQCLLASINAWDTIGAPLQSARMRLLLSRILLTANDNQGAELELSRVETIIQSLDAGSLLGECRALRQTLGRG